MSLPAGFPASLDALANPTATTNRDDAGFELDAVIARIQDILEALEAKVGVGASLPSAAGVLHETAPGVTAWGQVINADVSNGAGIAYGKLALANSIQSTDLAAGAAGPKKLGEFTADGTSPVMSISGIPATYRRLTAQWVGRSTGAGANATVGVNFEASPSAGAYYWQRLYGNGATAGAIENVSPSSAYITVGLCPAAASVASLMASGTVNIPEYANTIMHKLVEGQSASIYNNLSTGMVADATAGVFFSFPAITLVRIIIAAGGNWVTGSRLTLYGWPS